MKKYPKVDTVNVILQILKKEKIKPTMELKLKIEEEIGKIREFYHDLTEGTDPYPKEIIDVTDKRTGEKGMLILFENPLNYVTIIEDDGSEVSPEEVPEKEKIVFDLITLYVPLDEPQNMRIAAITEDIIEKIKVHPIKYEHLDPLKPLIDEDDNKQIIN